MSTKTLTKTQLIDQLAELRAHCNNIETQLASRTSERDFLLAQRNKLSPRAAYVHQRTAEEQRVHAEYAAALAAAKQLAMSTGKSVRVG